ncbi:LPD29 domain-containing protein [Streptomyces sp. NPDC058470]|uniref:LPD29 domain-containing protein n=1 Tax=Streptomyces sp. NPDC058470 TaxID=3346515 RepID=UPI003655E768
MTATMTATAYGPHAAGYLALRLPAGTWVRHEDDETRRIWIAQPCTCTLCMSATLLGVPATHYELRTRGGDVAPLVHVRYTSVVPHLHPDELFQTYPTVLPLPHSAVCLRKLLRAHFPGVRFSVRTRRGWRLSVSWSGGPSDTEVATVAAPLLADYSTPGRRRARPVTVTRFGRTTYGTPLVDAITLTRR